MSKKQPLLAGPTPAHAAVRGSGGGRGRARAPAPTTHPHTTHQAPPGGRRRYQLLPLPSIVIAQRRQARGASCQKEAPRSHAGRRVDAGAGGRHKIKKRVNAIPPLHRPDRRPRPGIAWASARDPPHLPTAAGRARTPPRGAAAPPPRKRKRTRAGARRRAARGASANAGGAARRGDANATGPGRRAHGAPQTASGGFVSSAARGVPGSAGQRRPGDESDKGHAK